MTELSRRDKFVLRITDWSNQQTIATKIWITLGVFAVLFGIASIAVLTLSTTVTSQWLMMLVILLPIFPACVFVGLIWWR